MWQTVRGMIVDLKEQGRALHICVFGRAAYDGALHHDRVWHMFTPDEFQAVARNGTVMHAAPEDGVTLVQAPLASWGAYFPALRALAQTRRVRWRRSSLVGCAAADDTLCRQVYDTLTQRQWDALRAFVAGLRPQEVAEQLVVSLATVNTHKTAILAMCREVWCIDEGAALDYRFIRERFGGFLERSDLT